MKKPGHALLLTGLMGSGKMSLATYLAETILQIDGSLEDYSYKLIIGNEESSIGIEPIRKLDNFLSLKVPNHAEFNRVVIIQNSHNLTLEAQNALLKTLEEPPSATFIILTAANTEALLPTIRSRAQLIDVKRPTQPETLSYFVNAGFNEADIKKAYSISGGLLGLMSALLSQEEHPLVEATNTARQFLKSTYFERLVMVDNMSKHKDQTLGALFIMQQMAHVSLQSATGQSAAKWHRISSAAFSAENQLNKSGQPKLVLTNLALAL